MPTLPVLLDQSLLSTLESADEPILLLTAVALLLLSVVHADDAADCSVVDADDAAACSVVDADDAAANNPNQIVGGANPVAPASCFSGLRRNC